MVGKFFCKPNPPKAEIRKPGKQFEWFQKAGYFSSRERIERAILPLGFAEEYEKNFHTVFLQLSDLSALRGELSCHPDDSLIIRIAHFCLPFNIGISYIKL